jgi:hypothetical protein
MSLLNKQEHSPILTGCGKAACTASAKSANAVQAGHAAHAAKPTAFRFAVLTETMWHLPHLQHQCLICPGAKSLAKQR